MITFSRARFFTSASTTHHGACGMSVAANIASLARENSTQRLRASRSIGLSFQRLVGILQPRLEAALLLGVTDGEPVLDQPDPAADEHPLELGAGAQELLVLLVGAEPHDPLDAGAVVPGPVEQDHLAPAGQVGDVALEVPLPLLALGGRRQRDDPGGAGVERLGDPLDRPALAGGVAALEDHDDPQAPRADVLLLLDQLDLQPGQLLLVVRGVDPAGRRPPLLEQRRGPSRSGHGPRGSTWSDGATTPSRAVPAALPVS